MNIFFLLVINIWICLFNWYKIFIIMFVENMFYEVNVKNYFLKIKSIVLEKLIYFLYNLKNNNKINSESCYKIVKINVISNWE